jgi:hypothetical protein
MKRNLLLAGIILLLVASCKDKEEDANKKFISIHSYINSQIAGVDTSLYAIIKLDIIDSTRTDTTYVKREEFRTLAKDFLDLPDIAEKKYRKKYKEESRYDEGMDRAIITYLPGDPSKAVIQRQEMHVKPNLGGGDAIVKTLYIDYLLNSKDSIVQKRMLWQVDRSFQVTTMKQFPGQAETISTVKVIWNEPTNQ